jgi:hypothetical protein
MTAGNAAYQHINLNTNCDSVVNTFHYYVGVTIWLDETAAAKPIFHSLK